MHFIECDHCGFIVTSEEFNRIEKCPRCGRGMFVTLSCNMKGDFNLIESFKNLYYKLKRK
jgi:Zn finger protein HypA/HybF involved in hydrogenase expression